MGLCAVLFRRDAVLLTALVLSAPALAYTNPQYGFTATAPQNWKQTSYPSAAVVFVSPRVVSDFRPNINVLVQPLPAGWTLEDYDALTLKQVK